jgi:putative transposase
MSEYRRAFVPGGTFFFAVVTDRRAPLFSQGAARTILSDVIRRCQEHSPIEIVAFVLLPEHLHAMWTLPPGDSNFSMRWGWIKKEFTKTWLAAGGQEGPRPPTRQRERRHAIWQRRFWEHTIRDEDDLEAHFDYIHYNPVKHGWVASPHDWPWSSFHRWVRAGHYSLDWASGHEKKPLPGNAGE